VPNQSALPDVPLLFESASPSDGVPLAVCASCNEPIRVVYYEANGSVVCSRCRGKLEAQLSSSGGMRRFRRALGFGLGAAIAGALFYYGFQVITGINLGLVAVLVGFMVGKAVFVGTDHRGGRRYQVLAVLLTYFAIASTYVPQVLKEARPGVGGMLLLTAAFPIIAGFSSIISVVILGVGLMQAWRMNRAVNVTVSGPYRIAGLPIDGELAT
jgi:hypothetical protein